MSVAAPIPSDLLASVRERHGAQRLYALDRPEYVLVADLIDEIERLREALMLVSEGRGRFSHDQLEHASNTVEDMKEIAIEALDGAMADECERVARGED